jgi:predicted S18 family serine protease
LDFEDSLIEFPIIDGPSAGFGFAVVVTAILLGDRFPSATRITGTISAWGEAGPVGGVYDKIEGCHSIYPRSRFVLPAGEKTIDDRSNAGRYRVEIFEAATLEDAYETVIGKPIRPFEDQ